MLVNIYSTYISPLNVAMFHLYKANNSYMEYLGYQFLGNQTMQRYGNFEVYAYALQNALFGLVIK